jgi:signal transduction histidine kinase
MGVFVIATIILTDFLARAYGGPEIAAVAVLGITVVLLIISHMIIKSFERLAEASRLKSEFIRILSHQIRAPLSSIKWQIESIFSGDKSSLKKESLNSFRSIAEENQSLINLINNLLEFRRIEDGNFVLHKTNFSITGLIRRFIKQMEAKALAVDATVIFHSSKEEIFVNSDENRIKIVLETLVDNALKYSVPRQGKKEEVVILAEEIGGKVKISVKDKGIGISRDETKYIFKKFFRIENALKYKTEGLGIGLYVAKKIIESSGGKMGFESNKEKGSIFWFTLPISS